MNFTVKIEKKNKRLYLVEVLIAIELLMSFSFLGYLHAEPISITTAYIPVLLAGALGGMPEAVVLGAVFGLASMWKASASYVMPFDQLFSPFLSGSPAESLILSVGARILFGLAIGLLYAAARRLPHSGFWICIVSFAGRFVHSFFVYGIMGLFFPEAGYHVWDALSSFMSLNNVAANLFSVVVVYFFWRLEKSTGWRDYWEKVERGRKISLEEHYNKQFIFALALTSVCLSIAVAVYFVHRMEYALEQSDIRLSDVDYSNLIHLQIQFVIGIISMLALVIFFLIVNRRYTSFVSYEAKIDAVTGLLTRKNFFDACEKVLEDSKAGRKQSSCFIMIDVDYFKQINDRYGHPEGDTVLQKVAQELRTAFEDSGVTGRIGGDEFAVLLTEPVSWEWLEEKLQFFFERIQAIKTKEHGVSCSAGAFCTAGEASMEVLYQEADKLLYRAKQKGRNRYELQIND